MRAELLPEDLLPFGGFPLRAMQDGVREAGHCAPLVPEIAAIVARRARHAEHATQMVELLLAMRTLHGARSVAEAVLKEEQRRLAESPLPAGFEARPEPENLLTWHCTFPGPAGTLWSGAILSLRIFFNTDYPLKPPHFKFMQINGAPPYHANVYDSGKVCNTAFWLMSRMADGGRRFGDDNDVEHRNLGVEPNPDPNSPWRPECCVKLMLISLQAFLTDRPDMQNPDREMPYRDYRRGGWELYDQRVREQVEGMSSALQHEQSIAVDDSGLLSGELAPNPF